MREFTIQYEYYITTYWRLINLIRMQNCLNSVQCKMARVSLQAYRIANIQQITLLQ